MRPSRARSSLAFLAALSGLFLVGACASHHAAAVPPVATKASSAKPVLVAPPTAAALGPPAIDAALREEWTRAGVVPAARADDATFLRRVMIDLVGTVPSAEETTGFLADAAPDKRARLVDRLLASPEYADHWMAYWDDVLMGSAPKQLNLVDRVAFRAWLRARFAAGDPWDRIVRELVSATGRNGRGGPKVRGPAMQIPAKTDPGGDDESPKSDPTPINGAVNWTLRFEQTPQDLGGSASRVFLGVQIQCAQCHDHKTESWTQEDFRRFVSGFLRAKVEPIEAKQQGTVKRVDLVDIASPAPRFMKSQELAPIARAKPAALDGTSVDSGKDTRKALAAWITSKDNRWFAKAFVNRMWGHLLGRGFQDPVDDMRPSNGIVLPSLLDRVAADFVAHDYDVKHLLRTICLTEAYQLAPGPASKGDPENKLWARFHLVPLGPEELLNAILRVTDLEATARSAGIADIDALRADIAKRYAFLFDTDEESDAPDYSGTVSQALALLNGPLVAQGARALPGSAALAIANGSGSDADKVDALAVRVLARHATADERARWVKVVEGAAADPKRAKPTAPARPGGLGRLERKRAAASPKAAAYEDLLWSLLNSSEFTFNH